MHMNKRNARTGTQATHGGKVVTIARVYMIEHFNGGNNTTFATVVSESGERYDVKVTKLTEVK